MSLINTGNTFRQWSIRGLLCSLLPPSAVADKAGQHDQAVLPYGVPKPLPVQSAWYKPLVLAECFDKWSRYAEKCPVGDFRSRSDGPLGRFAGPHPDPPVQADREKHF